jgi:DNA-binding transcriptional MerR regulator
MGGAKADDSRGGGTSARSLLPAREFSRITNIPISTLRYYDDIGLLVPVLRAENGYRYYAPHQIVAVKFILVLIDCGLPLKTISEFEANRTPKSLALFLHNQRLQMDREMKRILGDRAVMDVVLNLLTVGLVADEDAITVEQMPAMPIRVGVANDFKADDYLFYREYIRFLQETPQVNFSYPVGGLFTDMARWRSASSQPSHFFSIDPEGKDEKPAGTYLVGYIRGYYGQTDDLPERMAAYAKMHRWEFCGPVYNIYVQSEISVKDPDRYLMQASVPVVKAQI